ncbi:hypothetical protein EIP91_006878 [Steccherinum ochraceum]|uniref:Uncharacterized protein n=1 Tax=Steccherinum ochraceum TaxID=92696 RepID=A0A4R0R517_9APHY|nr:hypothetical protein EIP91_006878 [Steccherinum ochraceum]
MAHAVKSTPVVDPSLSPRPVWFTSCYQSPKESTQWVFSGSKSLIRLFKSSSSSLGISSASYFAADAADKPSTLLSSPPSSRASSPSSPSSPVFYSSSSSSSSSLSLTSSTPTSPPLSPHTPSKPTRYVPLEIWYAIIDVVPTGRSASYDQDTIDIQALIACCLTCQGWRRKAQEVLDTFKPKTSVTVSRHAHITAIPLRHCGVIESLTIVMKEDQALLSAALRTIGPKLTKLRFLVVCHLDLDLQHPDFYQICSILHCLPLARLTLENVTYTRFAHITRLMNVSRCHTIIRNPNTDSSCKLPMLPFSSSPSFSDRADSCILKIPWDMLRDNLASYQVCARHVRRVAISTMWPTSSSEDFAVESERIFRGLGRMFRELCTPRRSSEACSVDWNAGVALYVYGEQYRIKYSATLCRENEAQIILRIQSDDAEFWTNGTASRLLACLSTPSVDAVVLKYHTLFHFSPTTSPSSVVARFCVTPTRVEGTLTSLPLMKTRSADECVAARRRWKEVDRVLVDSGLRERVKEIVVEIQHTLDVLQTCRGLTDLAIDPAVHLLPRFVQGRSVKLVG